MAKQKKESQSFKSSAEQLRDKTAAYNKLSKEQRINSKEGRLLEKRIRELYNELKINESIMGVTRRDRCY